MDSCSKLKFTSEDNEDRISDLPDRVLTHILSLIPTKYAVLTSVLSSRWSHLWTSIHNLNFDDRHILNNKDSDESDDEEGDDGMFEKFVSGVIERCNSENIYNFRLACSRDQKISMTRLHDWIQTVLGRNVEKIEIKLYENHGLKLPDNLFTSESLVSLTLSLDSAPHIPTLSNCFPSLKFLSISLNSPSSDLAKKLFNGCPVLENLSLNCSSGEEVDMTNISAPRLKTLRINFFTDAGQDAEYELVLDAPLLEHICVEDKNLACNMKDPLPRLEEAILDVGYDYGSFQLRNALKLLGAVANTKYLSLSFQTTMALHHGQHDGDIPCFPNLTTLKLEIYEFMAAKMLPRFLKGSPNLEVLILDTEIYDEDECNYKRPFNWMCSDRVSAFFFYHLRVVKILSFSEQALEWNLIEFFLGKAEMLKKMIVRQSGQRKKKQRERISDKLSKLPKASEACVVKSLIV